MPDQENFISQIRANQGLINKVIFLYCDDQEERKDLQQEIISQAWSSYGSFRGDAKFTSWLYRVALNTAISSFKKEAKRRAAGGERTDHEPVSATEDESELLDIVLSMLNPIEKSVVLLLVEGYKQPEIASILGVSEGNTRIKIHRIRKKLKKYGITEFASK